jgi:hypothetical protein
MAISADASTRNEMRSVLPQREATMSEVTPTSMRPSVLNEEKRETNVLMVLKPGTASLWYCTASRVAVSL